MPRSSESALSTFSAPRLSARLRSSKKWAAQAPEEVGEDAGVVHRPLGVLEPMRADLPDEPAAELARIVAPGHDDALHLRHALLVRPLHLPGEAVAHLLALHPVADVLHVASRRARCTARSETSPIDSRTSASTTSRYSLLHDADELLVVVVAVHHLLLEELVDALVLGERAQLLEHRQRDEAG